MTKEFMAQNERPLNQAAKKAMESLGMHPNPERLYTLQPAIIKTIEMGGE